MYTDKDPPQNLMGIDKALNEKHELHGFRSGGGLRVIRITKAGKLTGYGENLDIMNALLHAEEDYFAGGRQYPDVYGEDKIHPHYLTGSSTSTDKLDEWILAGHTIDAKCNNGVIEVILKGTKTFQTPDDIIEEVKDKQEPIIWQARGSTFKTSRGAWFDKASGITTVVLKEAKGHNKNAWHYNVTKTGKAKDFMSAVLRAIISKEVEL